MDRAASAPQERAADGHEAARHGERAGAAAADEADGQVAAIRPRAARYRGRADAAGAFVGSALAAGAAGAASPPQAARMLPAPRTPANARRREKPGVGFLNGSVTNHLLKLGAGTP
jgi:hypothetical protein